MSERPKPLKSSSEGSPIIHWFGDWMPAVMLGVIALVFLLTLL